ncbi:SAV_915 family protein [Amycolatopsis cihanbeyliensis]|uniref:SAV_915 family protein n=1 Tax=Amycolatopsis cihanbeyliensis TaxID=1128664 RepID=UPI00319E06EE
MDPDEVPRQAPDGLYLLTTPTGHGGVIELWTLRDGTSAVMGYSSIGRLMVACGSGQPFRHMAADEVESACESIGAKVVVVDTVPPGGQRYPEVDSRDQPDLPLLDAEDPDQPVVYVPSRPYRAGQRDAVLELQPHEGRLTLLAYTSRELLEEGCGPYQAWVSIPSHLLEEAAWRVGAEAVLFNPVLSEESRHTAPVLDWTRRDNNR